MASRVGFGVAMAASVALLASGVAVASTPVQPSTPAVVTTSPWLALAATQGQADLSSLCYYDPSRRAWIPADSERAAAARANDASPAYRPEGGGFLAGRCGTPAPIAPLAVIAATVATAVYIASSDDDDNDPISPF